MVDFVKASSETQFETIATLAHTIWYEHYTAIIGKAQVAYMVNKFQTAEVMIKQAKEGYHYYIITYNSNAIGYLAIQKRNEDMFISKIYLLKESRGKKIGKKAMQYVEDYAKSVNCSSISLTVNKHNSNSIKAYEKTGFVTTEAIVTDIGNGFVMDDYVMVKPLN